MLQSDCAFLDLWAGWVISGQSLNPQPYIPMSFPYHSVISGLPQVITLEKMRQVFRVQFKNNPGNLRPTDKAVGEVSRRRAHTVNTSCTKTSYTCIKNFTGSQEFTGPNSLKRLPLFLVITITRTQIIHIKMCMPGLTYWSLRYQPDFRFSRKPGPSLVQVNIFLQRTWCHDCYVLVTCMTIHNGHMGYGDIWGPMDA